MQYCPKCGCTLYSEDLYGRSGEIVAVRYRCSNSWQCWFTQIDEVKKE